MDSSSILVLLCAALTLLSALLLVRRRNRQHQEALQALEENQEHLSQIELIRVQNPTDQDRQAYELIEFERQKVWKSFSTKTSIAPRKIYHLSFDLIQRIAAIYYPEIENPVFQASIYDLLELNYRIIERIKEYLEEFPLNTIKDMNIDDILRYKSYYDRVTDFRLVKLAKNHKYIYTVGKYAWMGYNALNPWYWGRKVVFTAGKEGALRSLLSVVITVVGEEAVLVYSKRNIRAKAVAVEKSIAFEMINMAISDGVVSQEEYDVLLDFIIKNNRLDDQIKVTLMQALLRKRVVKSEFPPDIYDEKARKRLLAEVERVAKADKFGLLKKREALKNLEESLAMTSEYRTQLELTPHKEVQSVDLMQQNRRREEAILRLMVQAGSVEGAIPESLREYIIQRASSYPLPFDEHEQQAILHEEATPTAKDTLTDLIRTKAEKERALADVLDALLWYLPFSRPKEEFYTLIASALDLKHAAESVLHKRLEQSLPAGKLIEKPPAEPLKYLSRLLRHDEQIVALQKTATKYTFTTGTEKSKNKDTEFWLCVTTQRTLVLAATKIDDTMYQHHIAFQDNLRVQIQAGRFQDTYILRGTTDEIRLESGMFRSAQLKGALQPYLVSEQPAIENP